MVDKWPVARGRSLCPVAPLIWGHHDAWQKIRDVSLQRLCAPRNVCPHLVLRLQFLKPAICARAPFCFSLVT
eukprot:COSAG04_NODE_28241_length_277_cov_0.573034_1_plen_71_part_10